MAEANQNFSQDFQNQFYGFFSNLTPGKKLSIILAILVVLVGLGLIIFNSQQQTYSVFMNGLTPKETAVVAAQLDSAQINYQLQTGGTGLLVSSDQIDEARLKIASSGVIDGNQVGFEIFDTSDFSATEFEQNVRYRRALEGELSRLIQKIEWIESAKVMIAVPEKSVFIGQRQSPTAAVQLTVRSSKGLSPSVTRTISNLVSSAIPNMTPENVRISDQYGTLYSSGTPGQISAEIRDDNLKYKYDIEQYLQTKVFSQLAKLAGPERVEVRVSADINFDESNVQENIVDPDSSTLVSQSSVTESSTGSRTIPVGIPGVTSNSPEIQAGSSEVANISDFSKKQVTSNYENSKKLVTQKINSGKIERVTVSVLIDDKVIERVDEQGKTITELVKWSEQERAEITRVAQVAVGFNEARGDKIEVINLSFNLVQQQNIEAQTEQQIIEREFWTNIIKYMFFTLVLLALIFIVIRPMIKRLFTGSDELNLIMGLPSTVNELETGTPFSVGDNDDLVTASMASEMEASVPPRAKILDLAREDPQRTANMVKSWLKEK